ncbi:MAG: 30S ribosomal protein S4 [Candidatus Kerfeldbacteria bacterium]|nr:30S ribosomal protein S4 [Candidatus Kerfeldbacteria bacterium]
MARNLDPKCKQCRREGEKLFLKGERCFTPKCPIVKRNYPPGQHGLRGRGRLSGYGLQLREKQKVKRIYRILEDQLHRYFQQAAQRRGNTAELFLLGLEMRLDNIVYRLGLAQSRDQARQLVGHGHVQVNGRIVNLPSYSAKVGDVISINTKSADVKLFEQVKKMEQQQLPKWLSFEAKDLKGGIRYLPSLDEMRGGLQTQLIVEYYSR